MSPLKQAMGDYLALRRSLGHKLAETERQLTKFVTYLDFIGAETVTMDAALAFVFDPDIDPASTIPSRRLSAVRGFARHLAGSDPTTQIPPAGLVTYRRRRRTPFLFSEGDVVDLIAAARATTPYPLRAVMLETLIGLLAVTGMRVGEAIRLERTDIDWADAVIEVRATQFGKSRNVPVAPTTMGTRWPPTRSYVTTRWGGWPAPRPDSSCRCPGPRSRTPTSFGPSTRHW